MIGQEHLLNDIKYLIDNSKFFRFSIICGPKGSGKKLLCKEISNMMKCTTMIIPDIKADTLRSMIQDAYTIKTKTIYIIPDADDMSLTAKNAILKVVEEPPNNAYFIMTLESLSNTLPTIRSRAAVFAMDNYKITELQEYYKSKVEDYKDTITLISDTCQTPGDIDYMLNVGITEFYEYAKKVFDNIAIVNGANAFKIGSNLCLKENTTGYDLKLFLRLFKTLCFNQFLQVNDRKYLHAMMITDAAIQKCSYKSVNKQMVFDMWVLDIRKEWM